MGIYMNYFKAFLKIALTIVGITVLAMNSGCKDGKREDEDVGRRSAPEKNVDVGI